jgi:phosphoglycolate phosphatase-like HAD superfamily hydrolase
MPDTILFDLDGALVDSGLPIAAVVNAAFAAHDLPLLVLEEIR